MALHYPIQLALAYLFLFGYLCRTLCLWAKLPGAVGVIFSGFLFSYFIDDEILNGRDDMQGLAFFLVLLTAGFEIHLKDVRPKILVYATVPASCEMLGIAAYAVRYMGYTWVEGVVLGNVLFALGDGLVIPRMGEFTRQFPGHPLPRLVFMFAPLEASFALTLFGVLAGLAEPKSETAPNMNALVVANIVRIVATCCFGALLGSAAGYLIPRRTQAICCGRQFFTGADVEAYLIILAVALCGFGLGAVAGGHAVIPMVFSPGSLFQPELLVIVIGAFFAYNADHETMHHIEKIVGGVWVFGQLVLFSMMGSKTDTSVFYHLLQALPLVVVGLSSRFLGMFFVTLLTKCTQCCNCKNCRNARFAGLFPETVFCFLSTLPRATIQSALGPVPLARQFFVSDLDRGHVRMFMCVAAKLYVVLMSIGGSILLDAFGAHMLILAKDSSAKRGPCLAADAGELALVEKKEEGITQDDMEEMEDLHDFNFNHPTHAPSTVQHAETGAETVAALVDALCEKLHMPKADLVLALRKMHQPQGRDTGDVEAGRPQGIGGNTHGGLPGHVSPRAGCAANGNSPSFVGSSAMPPPPPMPHMPPMGWLPPPQPMLPMGWLQRQPMGWLPSHPGHRLSAPLNAAWYPDATAMAPGLFATDGSPGYSRERALSLSMFESRQPMQRQPPVHQFSHVNEDDASSVASEATSCSGSSSA